MDWLGYIAQTNNALRESFDLFDLVPEGTGWNLYVEGFPGLMA